MPEMSGRTVRLLVIRHGEAEGNPDRRFIGQSDVPLSGLGRRQAERIAHRLAKADITHIVASDLSRAIDTITPLATAAGLPVHRDRRLREIANGEWTGLLPSEIEAGWPDLWHRYAHGEDVPRPGGERWAAVRVRTLAAVAEVVGAAPEDSTVVICTHGGPALGLVGWAAGIHAEGNVFRGALGPINNASISTIGFPGPRLLAYNDVGHLAEDLHRPTKLPF